MLADVGVTLELKQIPKGGDINAWRRGEAGDWDILGNGYGNQTGLAITNLQGQYGGTAAKEKTRDTYHGFVFPEVTNLLDEASQNPDVAARNAQLKEAQEKIWALWPAMWAWTPNNLLAASQAGHHAGPVAGQLLRPVHRQGLRLTDGPLRPQAGRPDDPDRLVHGDGGVRAAAAGPRRPRGQLRATEPELGTAGGDPQGVRARPAAAQPVLDVPRATCCRATSASPSSSGSPPSTVVLDRLPYTITLAVAAIVLTGAARHPARGVDGPTGQHGRRARRQHRHHRRSVDAGLLDRVRPAHRVRGEPAVVPVVRLHVGARHWCCRRSPSSSSRSPSSPASCGARCRRTWARRTSPSPGPAGSPNAG